jgi:hypothetical protein
MFLSICPLTITCSLDGLSQSHFASLDTVEFGSFDDEGRDRRTQRAIVLEFLRMGESNAELAAIDGGGMEDAHVPRTGVSLDGDGIADEAEDDEIDAILHLGL